MRVKLDNFNCDSYEQNIPENSDTTFNKLLEISQWKIVLKVIRAFFFFDVKKDGNQFTERGREFERKNALKREIVQFSFALEIYRSNMIKIEGKKELYMYVERE